MRTNDLNQPIGAPLDDWTARPRPPRTPMTGRLCRVEPVDVERHAADLYSSTTNPANWTYLFYGPFADLDAYRQWFAGISALDDPLFHTIVDEASGKAVGVASYLRIDPPNGVVEVGHLNFSPLLQRTATATEAMYLMMRRAFDELGYRRYEWKCDSLNAPSRRAAERLGFTYEGDFRQAIVVKGRNRDTSWYSIVDAGWPARKSALEGWLAPGNFDAAGRQRRRLAEFMSDTR
jgi:RimJ/RimL family protein N-acetyltransferase